MLARRAQGVPRPVSTVRHELGSEGHRGTKWGWGWLEERRWSGSRYSSALRPLSSLKGCSVPCAKPNSEGADVALCPRGKWDLKQPLEGWIDSGCMLVVNNIASRI